MCQNCLCLFVCKSTYYFSERQVFDLQMWQIWPLSLSIMSKSDYKSVSNSMRLRIWGTFGLLTYFTALIAIQCVFQSQCGVYGWSQKCVKLLHNRKQISRMWEFLGFYLYFCHVIQSFICFIATLRQVIFLTWHNHGHFFLFR